MIRNTFLFKHFFFLLLILFLGRVKEKPLGSLDLRQCNDIGAYEKGAGKLDTTRFNIDMGDKVHTALVAAIAASGSGRQPQQLKQLSQNRRNGEKIN